MATSLFVFYGAYSYKLAVERDETLEVLKIQVFSISGVPPDRQLLCTLSGQLLLADDKTLRSLNVQNFDCIFLEDSQQDMEDVMEAASARSQLAQWGEACSRVFFGDRPIVQPRFRLKTGEEAYCMGCAALHFEEPISIARWKETIKPESWDGYVTDIEICQGDFNVEGSPGFQRIPLDLNSGAGGLYAYLCVRKGGRKAPITSILLQFGDQPTKAELLQEGYVRLAPNCNEGNRSLSPVYVWYRRLAESPVVLSPVSRAIQDLEVIRQDLVSASPDYLRIPGNLNEGTNGPPIHIYARWGRIGAFTCATERRVGSSNFLFKERLGIETYEATSLEDLCGRLAMQSLCKKFESMAEQSEMMRLLQVQEANKVHLPPRIESYCRATTMFESPERQEKALKHIPVEELKAQATSSSQDEETYQEELLKGLLKWFKEEFFSWVNNAPCVACRSPETQGMSGGTPTPEELMYGASRVELYRCTACGSVSRFPRYNDPAKLLETRRGRCGEWANCFTLCCRAMGFDARFVIDFTDHVWTEVYSLKRKRWIHADCCENKLDTPLMYEVGWGKKLTYVFAFSSKEVVDVTRYTNDWTEVLKRRDQAPETWLADYIQRLDLKQRNNWSPNEEEKQTLLRRRAEEEVELQQQVARGAQIKAGELQGRGSGSKEWRESRRELGESRASEKETEFEKLQATHIATEEKDLNPTKVRLEMDFKRLFRQLSIGCGLQSCQNPNCASNTQVGPRDATSAAATSIKLLSNGGQIAICPEPGSFSWKCRSLTPTFFWPLCDMETNGLLLSQGLAWGHKLDMTRVACNRPLPMHCDPLAVGAQLSLGSLIACGIESKDDGRKWSDCTLLFLMRVEAASVEYPCPLVTFHLTRIEECLEPVQMDLLLEHNKLTLRGVEVESGLSDVEIISGKNYLVTLGAEGKKWHLRVNGDVICSWTLSNRVVKALFASRSAGISVSIAYLTVLDYYLEEAKLLPLVRDAASPAKLALSKRLGTPHDNVFSDVGLAAAQPFSGFRLSQVRVWHDEFIRGIQATYEDENGNIVEGPTHRQTTAGEASVFDLSRDEVIVELHVRSGAWMDAVAFRTNLGRQQHFGGNGGSLTVLKAPPGHGVRAFFGAYGDCMQNLGVASYPSPAIIEGTVFRTLKCCQRRLAEKSLQQAVEALIKYMSNVASNPQEPRFRLIRVNNKFFQSNVGAISSDSSESIMKAMGWEKQQKDGEEYYFLPTTLNDKSVSSSIVQLLAFRDSDES